MDNHVFTSQDSFETDSMNRQNGLKLRCDKVKSSFLYYYLSRAVTPGRDKYWTSRWPEEQTANPGEHETPERGRTSKKYYIVMWRTYV